MDVVYKIRNDQGKFSNGNAAGIKWTKNGKVWNSLPLLQVHLTAMYHRGTLKRYDGCDIVEYEFTMKTENKIDEAVYNTKLRLFYGEFKK
jgi:hypothetical protein